MYGFRALKQKTVAFVGAIVIPYVRRLTLMRSMFGRGLAAFGLLIAGVGVSHGYTTVQAAAGTPPTLEASFIAATTTQFNATVITNPFFPGTYQIMLNGLNPNYNPPAPSTATCFALAVAVDTTTLQADLDALVAAGPQIIQDPFVYGFADGMTYQQTQEEDLVGSYAINCSSPTVFNLIQTTSATFNKNTCQDVAGTINTALFEQSLSTPTVIPPQP